MIISWNWLKEYVDLDMPVETLVERLMMAGLNHEGTEEVAGDLAIDLEVTSNRPDCLSHIGVAREVAALFGRLPRIPAIDLKESDRPIESLTTVERADGAESWCPQYRARVIEGVRVGPSPKWLVRRLETLGLASINNVVDVTNYVLMECGQPLHAFDLGKLDGKRIVVRSAKAGETFLAINNREYKLSEGMGVIADATRAVAIAGVMGGKTTEVTTSTTTVLLESAEFDAQSVRRTSRALDLSSDSSYRFERKIDPAGVAWASDRAAALIAELAGGKVAKGFLHVGSPDRERPTIALRYSRVEQVLGIPVKRDQCRTILEKLGLAVVRDDSDHLHVQPPTFRRDLTREIDLVEEIGRIHGYEAVSQDKPIPITVSAATREERVSSKVREILLASGYQEAVTFSFVDEKTVRRVRPWTTADAIELRHSSRKQENRLRQSLIPSLLDAVRSNEARGNERVQLFEIAAVYLPNPQGGLPEEPTMLALAAMADLRELRGVVETILARLGIEFEFVPVDVHGLTAGQSAEYRAVGKPLAIVGVVDPAVRAELDLRTAVVAAEIRLDELLRLARLEMRFRPIPQQPAVVRDLAIVLDESIRWSQLEALARESAGPLLERLEFVDLYRGKQVEAGKKSIAFRLTFRAPDRTLTKEEVDGVVQGVVERISKDVGGKLRT